MTTTIQRTPATAQQPLIAALAGFVLGLIIGLPVLGWWLWPVQWTDASFADLRESDQLEYVRLVALGYAQDLNHERAANRIRTLGPEAQDVMARAVEASSAEDRVRVEQLRQVLLMTNALEPAPAEQVTLMERMRPILLICSVLTLLLVALAGVWYAWSSGLLTRMAAARPATATVGRAAAPAPTGARPTVEAGTAPGAGRPVSQFMTTYVLGDDLYDDSFSIDAPDGSFLGECGMGISETIGVGDPKKVMAFEVWLFDKNDIRTVTKVLMSEHAFRDEALKSRLAAKGEPVLVQPGDMVSMETASLVVTARVVDMAYGGGALPPNSYFERLTIELAAYTKNSEVAVRA
jgi:hypothetical protein